MSTVEDMELLRRDVHPVEVALPDGRVIRQARVFVTDERLLVYVARDGAPALEHEARVTDRELVGRDRGTLHGGERLQVRTPAGDVWVNADRGCGCHSPLKQLMLPVRWTR